MDDLRFALLIVGLVIVAGIALYAWFSRGRGSRSSDGLGTLDGDSYLENADFYDPVVSTGDEVVTRIAGEVVTRPAPVEDLGGVFTPQRESSGAEQSVDVSVLAGLRATYESTVGGDSVAGEDRAIDAAPRDFDPAPAVAEAAPEAFEPEPEPPQAAPEVFEPEPEAPQAASEAFEPAPEAPQAASEALEPAPEARRAASDAFDPAPDAAQPAPSGAAREDAGAGPGAGHADPLVVDMTRPMLYLMLIAREDSLSGRTIIESFDAEGIRPGALQLYYWQSESDPAVVVGVANVLEPGMLVPETLADLETPGLVTFMSVPPDMSLALKTLSAMVEVSRLLARRMDARVCDETQSTLTAQAENHLREKVADILRRDRI